MSTREGPQEGQERGIFQAVTTHIKNLCMGDSKRDTDIKNSLLDTMGGEDGGFERIALKCIRYHM